MKFLGFNMVWYRPKPSGWGPQMQPPSRGSKTAHVFGGPCGPQTLCGRWTGFPHQIGYAKTSDRTSPRCATCRRLLRRLKSRPDKITLAGTTYFRSLDYELYRTEKSK